MNVLELRPALLISVAPGMPHSVTAREQKVLSITISEDMK